MNKKKTFKKKNYKKIYFKNVSIGDLNFNIINILKKTTSYSINNKTILLSNEGVYMLNDNVLKKYEFVSNILNESNELIELTQYYKFKKICYQIPYNHYNLNVSEISFKFNDYFLTFELIDNKINDFYIKTNNPLCILNELMINEVSYIKKLLI
tara:strand:- start:2999 stop:3460 length:462 start_codon:yes stop_codon:yes gene_type:complete